MVKIKRIYDSASTDDGRRIYIDRLWPRGMKKGEAIFDEWLKEVSPSTDLRKWFAHDPDRWPEFKKRYAEELKEKKDLLRALRNQAQEQTITLLYSAKDRSRNNAAVMKEVLEKDGA
jgi:uncharacterized protein YeaO (DUF488 family)